MEDVIIRRYKKEDRDNVRSIAWNTSFIGESADGIFKDRGILEDFLTEYFTDYEPESCFVAEADNKVIGYLIGARNTGVLSRVFSLRILPRLSAKALFSGALFKKRNFTLISGLFSSLFKGEFRLPDLSKAYPATLHINLEKGFRDLGIGSRLMLKYTDYLIEKGISGVYLATMSEKAAGFFRKQGFNLLYEGSRSYFGFILDKDVPVYIFGKKLP